jgi:hypothetical protein
MANDFPVYIRAEYLKDGKAEAAFLADAQGILSAPRREFARFAEETQETLRRAVALPRSATGSLDLGTSQLQEAKRVQDALAISAREYANALSEVASKEGFRNQATRDALAAAKEEARVQEGLSASIRERIRLEDAVQAELAQTKSATDQVVQAQRRGTTADQAVINSRGAMRQAGIQAGQQLQDMVVQFESGTRATTIFAQQVPQLAFALSGLEGSANKTANRIGQFATFLSGPWGAAIFVATAVLGPFVAKLFESGDASKDAEGKTYDFSRSLNVLSLSASEATNAMGQLEQATRGAIAVQGDFLRAQVNTANQSVAGLNARIAATQRQIQQLQSENSPIEGAFPGTETRALQAVIGRLQSQITADRAALASAISAQASGQIALSQQRDIESRDPAAAARNEYNRQVGQINQRREASIRSAATDPLARVAEGGFYSQQAYEADLARLGNTRDAAIEADRATNRNGATPRDTSGADFRRASAEARRVATELRQLDDFAEKAAESIARINEQFNEQPKLVDQAAQATRQLDAIIADLGERKPANFKQMILDAEAAKDVIEDALVRPFEELERSTERRMQLDELVLAGREAEARALETIWQIEQQLGPLSQERVDDVLAMVDANERLTEQLELHREQQEAFLSATKSLRGELESLFSGEGFNIEQIGRQLQARLSVERIFGDALREIEDEVKSSYDTGIDLYEAGNIRAAESADRLATSLDGAADSLDNPGSKSGGAKGLAKELADIAKSATSAVGVPANDNLADIVVTATKRDARTISGMSADDYFDRVGRLLVEPLLEGFDEIVGEKLAGEISGILGSAAGGYLAAGPVGGILGALKGIPGLSGSPLVGGAFDGAVQGAQINAILKSIGIGGSKAGATVGGAFGGAASAITGIPGLDKLGALLGNFVGGLFKGSEKGSANIAGGRLTGIVGDNREFEQAAGQLAETVLSSLSQIADDLGATLNTAVGNVSIGVRDGSYRVDPTGRGLTKTKEGALDFGDDAEAAVRAAILDLVNDGIIAGLSAAEQRLLKAGDDIEKALRDVLDFRAVFDRLKAIKDPVGAQIDDLNDEFKGLVDLFTKAGASAAEFAQLEELYGIERANLIREATEQVAGSLKSLLSDLNIGDSGLSLRERRANAQTEYDALAARVRGGDTTAFDDFAASARQLLELERTIFGSQAEYFQRFDEVRALTQGALTNQQALIDTAANRDNPFGTTGTTPSNAPLIAAIDGQTNAVVSQLTAMNDNMATLIQLQLAGGGAGQFNYSGFGRSYF